jgi:hypothetical protein
MMIVTNKRKVEILAKEPEKGFKKAYHRPLKSCRAEQG